MFLAEGQADTAAAQEQSKKIVEELHTGSCKFFSIASRSLTSLLSSGSPHLFVLTGREFMMT
jgi:hypothetical protein